MNIGDWLGGLGLREYEKTFAENAIDADVLKQLTAEDLSELGVTLLGHRRKLLTAIETLRGHKHASSSSAEVQPSAFKQQSAASPERRHLTVLFCDLVGSTALSASLDPEDLREIIRRYHAAVADTVQSQGGFVAQYLGDGALIYFGYPSAHEDDTERAVRAAMLVRDATRQIEVNGVSLQVRAGLATGLVIVGDRAVGDTTAHEPQIMGETPNRAARLQAVAEPGGIVMDAATKNMVGRLFELRKRDAVALKGFDAPVESWDVLREAAIESRFEALRSGETPLVGRDEELDLLVRRWQQVKAGRGSVVMIAGEAGLGKSRLVSAFRERISPDHATELRYFCSPQHSTTALHPVAAQIARAAKFRDSDTAEQKLQKLGAIVERPEDVPFVADLLSIPSSTHTGLEELAPEEKRQRLFAAFSNGIETLARKGPVFVLIEDVHWIDPTTQELLDVVISRIERAPALLIVTHRPEFQPPWTGQPNVTALALSRLRPEDCAALVRLLTAHGELSSEMVDQIAERTDGIPLFAEELSKAVVDAGRVELLRNVLHAEANIPATLHASLIARLDHLGADARETAQAGSVIGREFSYALLTSLAEECGISRQSRIESALDALVSSGLIFARGAAPDTGYTFKHALVQDAAYATLLRTQRQKFHAVIAALMERDGKVAPEVLAYHFAGAGELEKAAEQWFNAGQAANERSANLEAIRSFKNALEIISSLPETPERKRRALEITGALCNPMTAAKWLMSETTEIITKAVLLARELGVRPPAVILYYQLLHHIGSSNHKDGLQLAKAFAEEAGPELRTRANGCIATSLAMCGGSLESALEYSASALAAYDRRRDAKQRFQFTYEPRCAALATQSLHASLRGYFEQAKAAEADALAYAAEFDHPQTTGHVLAYKLLRGEFQRDYSEQNETVAALLRHGKESQIVFWSLWANIFRGHLAAREGNPMQGIEMIDASLKVFAEMKFTYYLPHHLGLKARALELAGDLEGALATTTQAITSARTSGETIVLSDLTRLCGHLRLAQSGAAANAEVEASFIEAIALAQSQASKLHELRAATSLARLWRDQTKHTEAQDLLQPVYDWFCDGFEAPDLVEARAVLDGVSAEQRYENA